jgi:hypothetical protein
MMSFTLRHVRLELSATVLAVGRTSDITAILNTHALRIFCFR